MKHSNARTEPDALIAELEQARAQFQAAERRSRTYLACHGILDQTHVDVTAGAEVRREWETIAFETANESPHARR
jgi:hypothetical protein